MGVVLNVWKMRRYMLRWFSHIVWKNRAETVEIVIETNEERKKGRGK